ncbi:MAG TPA: D-aminoacylase [Vicinamibacteria bacterium]
MPAGLVLEGGTLVDGSGAPAVTADVALEGGRIAAVGTRLAGARKVDCSGMVVAPGFIDTHSHSDLKVLADPDLPMKVRQGITLEVLGQDGISVAPVRADERTAWREKLAGLLGEFGVPWEWSSVGEYLSALEAARPACDLAYLVPHGALRQYVMGGEDRRATATELETMRGLLRASFDQGGRGLSTGLIYAPCCYADTEELIALGKVLAERDRPLVVHMRSESDRIQEAIREMVRVAGESGCTVHISHLKIAGRDNWDKQAAVLGLVQQALGRGLRFTADLYPYAAGSTLLGAILPPAAHAGGPEATLARLRDPDQRMSMRRAMADAGVADWDNFWKWSGPEGIVIADIPSGRHPEWLGRSLAEVAQLAGKDPFEAAFDLLEEERLGVAMVSFSQNEGVMEHFLAQPFVNVCTDGLLGGRPHPRAYGTYPRVLGRYVREKKLLTLEEAVRKMTSQAAAAFSLSDVGLVQEGFRANLVVFDPATAADRATFEEPAQFPVGIRDVLVGGEFVVRAGRTTGKRPGKVVQ